MSVFVNVETINALPDSDILLVSTFYTQTDAAGKPKKMVLNVALDAEKANSDGCEFRVYIPAKKNYDSVEHYKMLHTFREGADFVPIRCANLQIWKNSRQNQNYYIGFADSFVVVDM
jgi:hypothetical protein